MELNRLSELLFTDEKVEKYKFRVVEAKILERLDYPYEGECICYYEGVENIPYNIGINDLIDKNIILYLRDPSYTNNKEKQWQSRVFSGIVSEVIYLGNKELSRNFSSVNRYYYRFKFSSQLKRLGYNKAYRIYNNKSVLEVLKHIFERSRGPVTVQVNFSNIQNDFPVEEYISQYNESDLEFLLRLCSRYGIYMVEQEEGIFFYDSLYKADFSSEKNKSEEEDKSKHISYPYNPSSDNYLSSYCISSIERGVSACNLWSIFSGSDASVPSKQNTGISQSSWEDKSLDNRDKITTYAVNINNYNPSFTNINYQNGLQFQATLNSLSNRVEALRMRATSNILEICLNDALTIQGVEGVDETYRVMSVVHYYHDKSEQGGRILKEEPALYSMYSNELHLIPNSMPYAMKVIEKPRAFGITTGVVIGNSDDIESERNSIVIDSYGRVRVQFASSVVQGKYDEEVFSGKYDYKHSCYLRYTSPVSSNHSGFIAVPRVGDEVVVSFIDGDPDRPIITGSLYNQETPSLIQKDILSDKHKTSLSSRTVGLNEYGMNELTMSNLPGSELIYLKAEKNYDELVQHDYNQTILNNKTSKVTGTHTESILQAHIQNIAGLKDVNVGGEYLTVVALSKDTAVGLSNTLNVGVSNKVNIAVDSSENVGKNKNVSVGGNLDEDISQDRFVKIGKDSKTVIKGALVEQVNKDSSHTTEGEYTLTVNKNMTTSVKEAIFIKSEKSSSVETESHTVTAKKDVIVNADNSTVIKVGSTELNLSTDSIIMKAGGIEVLIDSKGLLVKGGEVKSE